MASRRISRRGFLGTVAISAGAALLPRLRAENVADARPSVLEEFGYGDVTLHSEIHDAQMRQCHAVLMSLSDDSLLKPIRKMGGLPAPGQELGGWYLYNPDFGGRSLGPGFAPGCPFGQWISALSRMYAITGNRATRDKVLRLNRLYAKAITDGFYEKNRFPAYTYDKLVLGLIDSHRWAKDPEAYAILERTTNTALKHMPKTAIEHGRKWRPDKDDTYTMDESYTIAENLFLAYQRGAGERYRELGVQYLADEYYKPLWEGKNNLAGRHAYSHVNSLCSAMQAHITTGSENHLRAARNAFDMVEAQSFATGGWGPDEQLRAPNSGDGAASLSNTHSSFETPCGAYAHFKLTRYLLRVTRDVQYGDSMERVMYNTILGAKPLMPDGRTFYYSDYNFEGRKTYSDRRWPCCAGTMPQVTADYRINTYLRDEDGVYVVLYVPSTLRWTQHGSQVTLIQSGSYPYGDDIEFVIGCSRPTNFAARFRIPAWASAVSISVNGKKLSEAAVPGKFAEIRREWKNGDRVEMELSMKNRLQAIDSSHPDVVALLRGPLVLFPIVSSTPKITRAQLLAAEEVDEGKWRVSTESRSITMLPFTAIEDEQYSTYLKVAG